MINNINKTISLTLSALVIYGCSDIPDQTFSVEPVLYEKLETVQSITLSRNYNLFGLDCRSFEPGLSHYYLVSGDDDLSDDYAKWACVSSFSYLNCPKMKVTAVANKNEVNVKVIRGSSEDFTKGEVLQCARKAIEFAPTELKATSERVSNRDSWQK